MTGKLFAVLIVLSVALPVNAMTITASSHWLMVQEVSALNNQREFRLKTVTAFDPLLKDKIRGMRKEYNLLYAGILTKHGFAVNDINAELDAIWRKAVEDIIKRNGWLLMLVSPGTWDCMEWEEYKAGVFDFTKQRFKRTTEAAWNISQGR